MIEQGPILSLLAAGLLLSAPVLQAAPSVTLQSGDKVIFINGVSMRCLHACKVSFGRKGQMKVEFDPGEGPATAEVTTLLKPVELTLAARGELRTYQIPVNVSVSYSDGMEVGEARSTLLATRAGTPNTLDAYSSAQWEREIAWEWQEANRTFLGHRIHTVGER